MWFVTLYSPTNQQLANWKLIAGGLGIHWEDLDEDLSTEGLLTYSPPVLTTK